MKQVSIIVRQMCKECWLFLMPIFWSGFGVFAAPSTLQMPSALDFGVVPQETVNSRTISIKNPSSTDDVEIKIIVSCSCLEVKPDTIELKANSTAYLNVTYRSRNSVGKTINKIYVKQKGKDIPDNSIKVTADVYKLFNSQPYKVDFGLVPIGSSREADFQLTALTDKTFSIDKVVFDPSLLDVKYDKKDLLSKQKPLSVKVVLKNTVLVGEDFNDPLHALLTSIRFTLSDIETGATWRYSVTIRAKILGEIEVTPPKYSFIDQPHNARLTLKVQLKNRYGKPFSITGFSSFFGCTTAIFSKDAAVSHEIVLHIDVSKIDENVEDMLRFMTDLPIEHTIKMPVTILLK